MKTDIIIAGVGGQGILSIAAVIAQAAISKGLHIKQSEVHGMSQRGGDVQSNLRISDAPVASDLIPLGHADLIISLEPMESLRYAHLLHKDGWIVTAADPVVNISNYPEENTLREELNKYPNTLVVSLSSSKYANITLLGAAAHFIGIDRQALEESIRTLFSRKGEEVVAANIASFSEGYGMKN
jgi:indolepyruvate ferredoxin oxidoreductase beta subunit